MKRIVIEDETSAVEYIETVLNDWKAWHSHHPNLVQALRMLLKINESKNQALIYKCEYINDLKEYITALHRIIEKFGENKNE